MLYMLLMSDRLVDYIQDIAFEGGTVQFFRECLCTGELFAPRVPQSYGDFDPYAIFFG